MSRTRPSARARLLAAAALCAVPVLIVACDDGDSPDGTTPTQEVNPDSTTTNVPQSSTSVAVPTTVTGGPAGQGSVPEQPGGTAQPMDPDATNTTMAP